MYTYMNINEYIYRDVYVRMYTYVRATTSNEITTL